MNTTDTAWLMSVVSQLAFALPRLLVAVVGLGLALAARRRHATSARLAIGGFALMLLLDLVLHPLQTWALVRGVGQGIEGLRSLGTLVLPLGATLLSALAWALLLGALHQAWTTTDRDQGPRPPQA
jgi:hypothetical protein